MPDLAKDGVTQQTFDELYRDGAAAWEIGRPQPEVIRLADAGFFAGRILDIGCGTGENALMLTSRGLDVLGIDQIEPVVQCARAKAGDRGLAATFKVHDALMLQDLGLTFDTVLDSAVFHGFSDEQRPVYAASIAAVLRPGGRMAMICFSEAETRDGGPRRVSQQEIRDTFKGGWAIDEIRPIRYEAKLYGDGARCWLTLMRRTGSADLGAA